MQTNIDREPLPANYHIVERHDDEDGDIFYEVKNYATETTIFVHGPSAKTVSDNLCDRMNDRALIGEAKPATHNPDVTAEMVVAFLSVNMPQEVFEWLEGNLETRLQLALNTRSAVEAKPAAGHKWDRDGERCIKCGAKDWMGGGCIDDAKRAAVPPVLSHEQRATLKKRIADYKTEMCFPYGETRPGVTFREVEMLQYLERLAAAPQPSSAEDAQTEIGRLNRLLDCFGKASPTDCVFEVVQGNEELRVFMVKRGAAISAAPQPSSTDGKPHTCVYSRSMNQPYPRKCLSCGGTENANLPS